MNMIYWGLALTSIRLSDDNFTGYFISAFMDVPAAFLSIPLLTKFGRRTLTFCGLLLQGICMYGAAYFKGWWLIISIYKWTTICPIQIL